MTTEQPPTETAKKSVKPGCGARLVGATWRVGLFFAAAYVMVCVVLMMSEEQLLFPAPNAAKADWEPAQLDKEDVWFAAEDGVKLHGWLVRHPEPERFIIYFHGNGDQVADLASLLADYRERFQATVFSFDYRGYGRSEGSSSEAGLRLDSEAAMQVFLKETGVKASEVDLIGRSLGGAMALHVAAKTPPRSLVLERTFARLVDAAADLYWWAPVRLLLRNRIDSLAPMALYEGPLLQSHGEEDPLVPWQHGERLFETSPSSHKQFIKLPGVGHNGRNPLGYESQLDAFIREPETVNVQ
ncbi:MAG: alpha/beta hydrolase [bacterium]|nr:alpha/beta hydrolase [bacterium]